MAYDARTRALTGGKIEKKQESFDNRLVFKETLVNEWNNNNKRRKKKTSNIFVVGLSHSHSLSDTAGICGWPLRTGLAARRGMMVRKSPLKTRGRKKMLLQ